MRALTLIGLALAAIPLVAGQKITTGPPKLEVEAGAQEGPSWDPAGWLYFVGRNQVSRLNLHGGATQGKVGVFLDKVANPNTSVVDPQGRVPSTGLRTLPPSTVMAVREAGPPNTETLNWALNWAGFAGVTWIPGSSWARFRKLRPFSGRSSICWRVTTPSMVFES